MLRYLLWCLLWCAAGSAQAVELLFDNFDDPARFNRNWYSSTILSLQSDPRKVERGLAAELPAGLYMGHALSLPSNAQSVTISFWLRAGDDSFSQSLSSASLELYFGFSPWYTTSLHSGSVDDGAVLHIRHTFPASAVRPGLNYLLLNNRSSAGSYHIDNLRVTTDLSHELDDYRIDSQAQASVCAPHAFTLSALDRSGIIKQNYEGLVNLSTSSGRGNWSMLNDNGRLSPGPANSGRASYQFNRSDYGQVQLLLSNEHVDTLRVTAEDTAAAVSRSSGDISFADNAFVFELDGGSDADLIAFRRHGVNVSLVKKDPSNNQCGVVSSYNRQQVQMALQRHADDPGGAAPLLSQAGVNTQLDAQFKNINLNFSGGRARFLLDARDVGRYALHIRDTSRQFSDRDLSGSSADIVARPLGFYLYVYGPPTATWSNGPAFKKAGENFGMELRAVGWLASSDSDNNGVADNHNDTNPSNNADLSNNPVLPSFGNGRDGAQVNLQAVSYLPTPLNHSQLSGDTRVSAFSAGRATNLSVAYSNVGLMEINAQLPSYLGLSQARLSLIHGRSGHVGRFIPDHFTMQAIQLEPACTRDGANFSHMGQEFQLRYTLTARNASGAVTDGYRDAFIRLRNNLGQRHYRLQSADGNLLGSRLSISEEQFAWQANAQLQYLAKLKLNRGSEPEAPLKDVLIGLELIDQDGARLGPAELDLNWQGDAANDHRLLGSSDFYYSRLRLDSAQGPENKPLGVNFWLESFAGNAFVKNQQDTCSRIQRSDITYVGRGSIDVDANRTTALGSRGEYANLDSQSIYFDEGDAGHYFSAPGRQGEFQVDVDLTAYPWLRFDWNQDGDHSDPSLPRARYRFGNQRGHDRIIYWREVP
ncbi:MAG: hypothetical protein OIF35_01820 [Cellvibrionaceae bacterium]|nr:hypothetical protein [Cellvibrionaceae bacterium]MCV6624764.1 hypothetical protein [Cellvibrionaceae bacterium]